MRGSLMLHDVSRSETDQEFRNRLLYVAGDGQRDRLEIEHAIGEVLDEIADRFNLRRRRRTGSVAR